MELGDNKQICRLCLEIQPPGDAEAIGEKKKEILKILQINDLRVTDSAVACSRCMEELQSGFEFKSACLHVDNCISTFVDAGIPVDIKEVFQSEMRGTAMANVNLANRQICRLCMSIIDEALDCNTVLKDIRANCLPEVDVNTVREPVVCELCFSRIKKLNEFMKTCQEVERRVKNYCQAVAEHAIPVSVNLHDLLKLKEYTINKPSKGECSNIIKNGLKNPKKEDAGMIECEEVHIKDELDNGELPAGKKMYNCLHCDYKSNHKTTITRHMSKIHKREQATVYYCDHCTYESLYVQNLYRHLDLHGRANKRAVEKRTFECPGCKKGFHYKQTLNDHLLQNHENFQHLVTCRIHYCKFCPFKTVKMTNWTSHVARNHGGEREKKFHCHHCGHSSSTKDNLRKHLSIHSNLGTHQCAACEKVFKRKSYLDNHILMNHKENTELLKVITNKIYHCTSCTYVTLLKGNLCRHIEGMHKK